MVVNSSRLMILIGMFLNIFIMILKRYRKTIIATAPVKAAAIIHVGGSGNVKQVPYASR